MSDEQPKNEWGQELERLFEDFAKSMTEGNIGKASVAMNALWVMFQIFATSVDPKSTHLQELTYLKTPFSFDNGGKYLLTFHHVDGPKIQLRESSGTGYTKPFEEVK